MSIFRLSSLAPISAIQWFLQLFRISQRILAEHCTNEKVAQDFSLRTNDPVDRPSFSLEA